MEPHDARLGITEDAADGRFGDEAREAIGVLQASLFSHSQIMACFATQVNEVNARKTGSEGR